VDAAVIVVVDAAVVVVVGVAVVVVVGVAVVGVRTLLAPTKKVSIYYNLKHMYSEKYKCFQITQ